MWKEFTALSENNETRQFFSCSQIGNLISLEALCQHVAPFFSYPGPMVNRRISSDLKECALQLWEAGWEEIDITQGLIVS